MESVIRATVVYWFLWLVVRGTGKRSIGEMSPIDLLLVVVIGDIVQQGVTQEDMSITGAILSAGVFALWMLIGDAVSRGSSKVSRVLNGSPVYVIEDGRPDLDAIHRERMTIEDVFEAARQKGFADLRDVTWAVFEPDGTFSFVPAATVVPAADARTSAPVHADSDQSRAEPAAADAGDTGG